MMNNPSPQNRVRLGLFISIFICIASFYLATYSGRIESSDSLRIIDATSSFVHFGDTLRDESYAVDPLMIFSDTYPLKTYESNEPLSVYIASIFYSIANTIGSIGLVHTTWLQNIVVVALTSSCIYALGTLQGYSTRTAILTALLFGLGTIAWVYTKTLFRDPLIMLFLVLIAICLEKWRQNYKSIIWLIVAVILIVIAIQTKNSALMALPALFLWSLPNFEQHKTIRYLFNGLLVAGIVLLISIIYVPDIANFISNNILPAVISIDVTIAPIAFQSYFFSIGGSLWGTSPILLLGLAGIVLLIKQGKDRIVWGVVTLVMLYAGWHALLTSSFWFGGLSYPPRFLLPTVPFLVILLFPVIEWVSQPNQLLSRLIVILLSTFSVAIQFIAVVSFTDAYTQLLPPESMGLVEWLPGLYQPQYLRWVLLPQTWSSLGWDIAWLNINADYLAWSFILLSVITAGLLLWHRKYTPLINIVSSIVLVALLIVGLRQLYTQDTRYWAQTPELFDMLAILENETADSDSEPLLLAGSADVTYERFILNYNRLDTIRPIVLGFQRGAVPSAEVEPRITSDFVPALLNPDMLRLIDYLANQHDRLWWLAHNSEFLTWTVRPEERYLTSNYYLLNEYRTDNPAVRLLEFATVRAPSRDEFRLPENLPEITFGDAISLTGYTLPNRQSYIAGDVMPMTFFWQTNTILDTNYIVSWFLVNPSAGYILQGIDSAPDAGFAPTIDWQPEQLIYDNRAIELPADAPAGDYQIWVRLYVADTGGAEQLSVSGAETYEETTAILPITISVTSTP